jgi:hypothetical protein
MQQNTLKHITVEISILLDFSAQFSGRGFQTRFENYTYIAEKFAMNHPRKGRSMSTRKLSNCFLAAKLNRVTAERRAETNE